MPTDRHTSPVLNMLLGSRAAGAPLTLLGRDPNYRISEAGGAAGWSRTGSRPQVPGSVCSGSSPQPPGHLCTDDTIKARAGVWGVSQCGQAAGGRSLRLGGLAACRVVESLGLPILSGISLSGESTQEFVPPKEGSSPMGARLLPGLLKCLKNYHPAMQLPMLKQDNLKQKESRVTKIMTPRLHTLYFNQQEMTVLGRQAQSHIGIASIL